MWAKYSKFIITFLWKLKAAPASAETPRLSLIMVDYWRCPKYPSSPPPPPLLPKNKLFFRFAFFFLSGINISWINSKCQTANCLESSSSTCITPILRVFHTGGFGVDSPHHLKSCPFSPAWKNRSPVDSPSPNFYPHSSKINSPTK